MRRATGWDGPPVVSFCQTGVGFFVEYVLRCSINKYRRETAMSKASRGQELGAQAAGAGGSGAGARGLLVRFERVCRERDQLV
jgi:hypothetical protein